MQSRHILPLTGIRFFAAVWIVLFHFPLLGMLCPVFHWTFPVTRLGNEAVPFFFLLSGFILSQNYFPRYSIAEHPKFIFLRFARLWPVHFVMLLLSAPPQVWPGSRFAELFMVRMWYSNEPGWNAPAWSISAEWFAYICVFPLVFLAFKRINSVPGLILIVVACLAAQATSAGELLFSNTNECGRIFFLFIAGGGLYRLRSRIPRAPAEAIVTGGVFFALAYLLFQSRLSVLVLYAGFAMMIFGLSYERGLVARFLSTKPIVLGGLASYSLYMTHYLVIQSFIYYTWPMWGNLEHSPFTRYGMLLAAVVSFTVMTAVFYRYIEVPANRWLRGLWERRSPKTVSEEMAATTPAIEAKVV